MDAMSRTKSNSARWRFFIEQAMRQTYHFPGVIMHFVLRLIAVIGLLCVASVAEAQTPEKKSAMTADQCSRQCTKLCFAADPLCINKCQSRCEKTGSAKR